MTFTCSRIIQGGQSSPVCTQFVEHSLSILTLWYIPNSISNNLCFMLSALYVNVLPYLFCCSFRHVYFIMAHKFIAVKDNLEITYIN